MGRVILFLLFVLGCLTVALISWGHWQMMPASKMPLALTPGMPFHLVSNTQPQLQPASPDDGQTQEGGAGQAGGQGGDQPALLLEPESESALAADPFARDTYQLTPVVCPFKTDIDYKPGEISCGLLQVPENRDDPASRQIELHYVKIAARPADKHKDEEDTSADRPDPVIYLTGGPGVRVNSYVSRLKGHGIVDHRDLYILEQRGIGFSGNFCPFFSARERSLSNPLSIEEREAGTVARTRACFERAEALGVDLRGYSTIEVARDVKALRTALELSDWNVWGISYGSVVGQAYLREDPEGIRAAILDAIVPLDRNARPIRRAQSMTWSLEGLQESCNADPVCAATYPNMIGTLRKAMMGLENDPAVIEAGNPELFPKEQVALLPSSIGGVIYSMLYNERDYPRVPGVIKALDEVVAARDFDRFKILGLYEPVFGGSSRGMYWAVYCRDGWMKNIEAGARRDADEHPVFAKTFFQPGTGEALAQVCRDFGLLPRPASEYTLLQTDIPSLIIEGALDPATPPPLAKSIMPGFTNGTYIEFPHAGHGPTRSVKCAAKMMTAFFDDPTAELDQSCVGEMKPPEYLEPLFLNDTAPVLLARALEEPRTAAPPVIFIAVTALILALGALAYTLAPLMRLVEGEGVGPDAPPVKGARVMAWATAVLGTASLAGVIAAALAAMESSEIVLALGLAGYVVWFLWAGLAAGLTGALTLVLGIWGARSSETGVPRNTVLGLTFTGFAGMALALQYAIWGFLPF